jgi:plastocyanin
MHRLARRLVLAGLLAALAIPAAAGPSMAVDKWVTMYANAFLPPGPTTIEVGDKVTWVNDDDVAHDAVGSGWSTPLLSKGDSHAVRFLEAGTYGYVCSIHPDMTGSVVVRAASSGGGPPTDAALPGSEADLASGGAGSAMPVVLVAVAAAGAFLMMLRRAPRPR